MHTKRFNTFSKRWVQFRVGAIPCLPCSIIDEFIIRGFVYSSETFFISIFDKIMISLKI